MVKNMKTKICILSFLIITGFCCSKSKQASIPGDKQREYANALFNRELYSQAIEEYEKYLDNYEVPPNIQASINYEIGNIYFERINDYENAMSHYLKIKHLFPESNLVNEANKKIIACLERLDKSIDAQQVLKESAMLDPAQIEKQYPGEVIAQIGDTKITLSYLNHLINKEQSSLPPEYRKTSFEKEDKLEFLKRYLMVELLYNSALRKGLDKDKEIIEAVFQAKKNYMANRLVREELQDKIKITQEEMKLYYEAHKDKFAEKDENGEIKKQKSFEESRKEIASILQAEKEQKAMDDLLQRLMAAQNVQIYEDKVK